VGHSTLSHIACSIFHTGLINENPLPPPPQRERSHMFLVIYSPIILGNIDEGTDVLRELQSDTLIVVLDISDLPIQFNETN
jgi:hypothetical protein